MTTVFSQSQQPGLHVTASHCLYRSTRTINARQSVPDRRSAEDRRQN